MMPSCPDYGSESWSQIDNDPLRCNRCGAESLVPGMHNWARSAESVLTFTVVTPDPTSGGDEASDPNKRCR